jgi:hypothetical protein
LLFGTYEAHDVGVDDDASLRQKCYTGVAPVYQVPALSEIVPQGLACRLSDRNVWDGLACEKKCATFRFVCRDMQGTHPAPLSSR